MNAIAPTHRPVYPFLSGMSEKHLELMRQASAYAEFGSGEVIFREGGPANCFYLIEKGKVSLEADMNGEGLVQVAELNDGDPLGWSWMFPPYVWHFHARALRRTTMTYYDANVLRQCCEQNHDFGYELLRRISEVMLSRLQSTRRELLKFYSNRSK